MIGKEVLLCICLFVAIEAFYVPPHGKAQAPAFYPLYYYYDAHGRPIFLNSYPGLNLPTAPPPPPTTTPPAVRPYHQRQFGPRRGNVEYEIQSPPQAHVPPAPVVQVVEPPVNHCSTTKDFMCNCNWECGIECRRKWDCT